MSDTKWTPGPWEVSKSGGIWADTKIASMENEVEHSSAYRTKPYHEHVANAHLIAAAPELIDALETLHERLMSCCRSPITVYEAYDSFYQGIVSNALKNARGES